MNKTFTTVTALACAGVGVWSGAYWMVPIGLALFFTIKKQPVNEKLVDLLARPGIDEKLVDSLVNLLTMYLSILTDTSAHLDNDYEDKLALIRATLLTAARTTPVEMQAALEIVKGMPDIP